MSSGNENPYRTDHLDPRVDGGQRTNPTSSASNTSVGASSRNLSSTGAPSNMSASNNTESITHPTTSSTPGTGLSAGRHPTGTNPFSTGEGDTSKYPAPSASQEQSSSITHPSSTSTPGTGLSAARHETSGHPFSTGDDTPKYSLGKDQSESITHPTSTSTPGTGLSAARHTSSNTSDEPSTMSKILGAVGLGSLAGGEASHEQDKTASTNTSSTSATTGASSNTTTAPTGTSAPRTMDSPSYSASNTTGMSGTADSRTGAPSGAGFGLGSSTAGVADRHYDQAADTRADIVSGETIGSSNISAPVSSSAVGTSSTSNTEAQPHTYHDIVTAGTAPTSTNTGMTGTRGTGAAESAAAMSSMPGHHDTTSAGTAGSNRYTIGGSTSTTSATGTPATTATDTADHTAHPSTLGAATAGAGVGTAAGLAAASTSGTGHLPGEHTRETTTTGHMPAGSYNQETIGGATPIMMGDHDAQARARHAAEEETRKRREREAAAGVGSADVSGGMFGHEHHDRHQPATTAAPPNTTRETIGDRLMGTTGASAVGAGAAGATLADRTRAQPSTAGTTQNQHEGLAMHDKHFDLVDADGGQRRGSYATTAIGGQTPVTAGDHVARDHARYLSEQETARRQERERAAGLTDDGMQNTGMFGMEHKHKHNDNASGVSSGAATGAGIATGAGVAEHHHRAPHHEQTGSSVDNPSRLQSDSYSHDLTSAERENKRELEKKPSIFKRIFKRRKNKDTGIDEDYSTDDEEDKARHYASTAGAGSSHTGSSVPTHHSDSKHRSVLGPSYEEATGGIHKPSYNLFHKEENPAQVAATDAEGKGPTTVIPSDRSAAAADRTAVETRGFQSEGPGASAAMRPA